MGRKPKQEFVNVTQFCRTKRLNYTDFLGLVNYFKPPIVYEDARQKVFRYGDLNKLLFGEPHEIEGVINLKSYIEKIIAAEREGYIDLKELTIEGGQECR